MASGPASQAGGNAADGSAAGPRAGRLPMWRWAIRILLVIGAVVVAYVWYAGSHVDSHTYGAAELASGPVTQIIRWDDKHTAVQTSRLTDVPADQLWKVVTDQGRFDQFMPYVRKTTIERLPNGKFLEKQILDLPHATYDVQLEITLDEKPGVRRAQWRQVNDTLTFNEGAWVVEEADGKSILRYQVAASVDWLPQCVVNFALRPRLNRLLRSVEQRVHDLNEKEPQYFQRQ